MKNDFESNDDLLKKLVLSGDTFAFFALTEPYFKGRYLRVRSGGTAMSDAQKMVLDEAVELLEAVQHVSFKHFDAWFDEHCSLLPGTVPEADPGGQVDVKLLAETENFIDRCSRELLRTGSDLKRATNLRRKKFPQVLLQRQGVVWLLIGLAAAGAIVGTTFLMVKTQMALQVHFLFSGKRILFQYPPAAWVSPDSNGTAVTEIHKTEIETVVSSDSSQVSSPKKTPADTLLQKDQPVEKVVDPAVQSAVPEHRSLPPVVPKARLILPPPPPPPPEPVEPVSPAYQEMNLNGQQSEPTPTDLSPPPEPESSY
jgi:hypothetical protein